MRQSARPIPMSSAHKKVIVRRFTGETLPGYLPCPPSFEIAHDRPPRSHWSRHPPSPQRHQAHLLRPRLQPQRHRQPRAPHPPRLPRPPPHRRPLAPHDLPQRRPPRRPRTHRHRPPRRPHQDSGLHVTPPDTRSNTQRIYVPRTSITELQLIAVITTPSRRKPLPAASVPSMQEDLFDNLIPPNTRPN